MTLKHILPSLHVDPTGDEFITSGRAKNSRELFRVEMEGSEWHTLIEYLRLRAQKSDSYLETKNNVILAEEIHRQIREQGF